MTKVTTLKINIIIGIIEAIDLLTNKFKFVTSLLALSKRSSLCFSLPKARIILNFGITTANATAITPKITRITTAMIHVIDGDSFKTLIKAPIPIIGAKHTIRKSIIVTICT